MRIHVSKVVIVFTAVFFASTTVALGQEAYPSFVPDVERILAHWGVPGAVVTVVQEGQVLFAGGVGNTRLRDGVPMTGSTLTTVASVSKPMTAATIGILVDEGLLAWDDPLKKYIPEFSFADAYRTEHTTIRDVLSHRSGLPTVLGSVVDREHTADQLLSDLRSASPRMPFRDQVDYSQVGLALAGEVAARVVGQPWPEVVRDYLFKPLDMESTYPTGESLEGALGDPDANPHLLKPIRRQGDSLYDATWNPVNALYSPAGGVVTNAEDMAELLLAFLESARGEGPNRLLSQDSWQQMSTAHGSRSMGIIQDYEPLINPAASLIGYGLGFVLHEYADRFVAEHGGSNFGTSVMALIPDEDIGVFVSSNATFSVQSDAMVSAIKFVIIDDLLGLPATDWVEVFSSR